MKFNEVWQMGDIYTAVIKEMEARLSESERRVRELESQLHDQVSDKLGGLQNGLAIESDLLFNAISHPVAILDREQTIVAVNDSLLRKIKNKQETIVGKKCWEVFHSKSTTEPPHKCPFQTMSQEQRDITYEMEMQAFDGTFLVTCTPIFDKEGSISHVIHIATDISDRKEMETNLKANEAKMRLINDHIVDIIWQLTSDFRFTYLSPSVFTILGYKPEELIGKTLFEMMEPRSRTIFLEELAKIEQIPTHLRAQEMIRYELQFVRKDGLVIWCEIHPSYRLDSDGRLVGFQGVTREITERKNYEINLKMSEKKWADIIDFLPDPTFAIDSNGTVIAWNKAIEQMTGVEKSLVVGKDNFEYSFAFYGERRPMLIDLALSESDEYRDLYDYTKRIGETIVGEVFDPMFNQGKGAHLWGKATALLNERGEKLGAIESIRDITDIRSTEKELIDNKRKLDEAHTMLQNALNSIPVRVFWKDLNFVFRGCNKLFAQDLGFESPEQVIGLTDYDICNKELADEYRKLDESIINTGIGLLNREEPPSRNSGFNWINTSKVPLEGTDGDIIGILGIYEDITDIKNAELALIEADERLRLVHDAVNDGVWDWDLTTNKVVYSDRYFSMLGYHQSDFENHYQTWATLIHPDDYENTRKVIDYYIAHPDGNYYCEFRMKHANGNYIWILARGKAIKFDEDSKPTRMIGTHTDISIRKDAQEKIIELNNKLQSLNASLEKRVEERTAELQITMKRLEDSNTELIFMNEQAKDDALRISELNEELQLSVAAKDKFFSTLAHELKTSLSGFLLLSDMMAKDFDELSVKDMKKMAKTINASATGLYNMLESLLQWSRFQLGTVAFTPEHLSLYEIVSNVLYIFNNHAKSKQIVIDNKIPNGTFVLGDRNMITSIFRNLISNAIKFSHSDAYIRVGILNKLDDGMLELFVEDQGVGIPQDSVSKVFNLDTHFSTKGTNDETGSGLGLIITKDFIEKHKGKIRINSEVGKGTIVHFTLPSK